MAYKLKQRDIRLQAYVSPLTHTSRFAELKTTCSVGLNTTFPGCSVHVGGMQWLFFRRHALPEGRMVVHLSIQLNSATTFPYHLYCTHLLIQQILSQHFLCARYCALSIAFPADTVVPRPNSLLCWINFPSSRHISFSSGAQSIQSPRSPAS